MNRLIGIFCLLIVVAGCTHVSRLGQIKRGEGTEIIYDLDLQKMKEICELAVLDVGLEVRAININNERIEILAYEPVSEIEYGSSYGIFLYPLSTHTTQMYYVRRTLYPTRVFARDATKELLAKIDHYVLDAMGI